MTQILASSWSRNTISAILAVILFALLGIAFHAPPPLILLAAATFGGLLVIAVQLGMITSIICASRGTPSDLGQVTLAEVESPEGKHELEHMSFRSLLTIAIIQELYVSLFRRDRPVWASQLLEYGPSEDYGAFGRYLEWMLILALGIFTFVTALLISWFSYLVAASSSGSSGFSFVGIVCALPAFLIGGLLMLLMGLFFASVVRRMWILYATRAEGANIA